MRAVTYRRYGGPDVLELSEMERPEPGEGEVLVRVHASSINSLDGRMMRADPFLIRFFAGLLRPKHRVLGADFAGTVERVGPQVTRCAVGDAVLGDAIDDRMGAFAEYVVVRESQLAVMPQDSSFEDASTLPVAGVTALQAVRDLGELKPGMSVLIQGAGGGVGTYLVQIAQAAGARVTAVCGPGNVELMLSLGAERVIDYTKTDFVAEDARYDVIFGVNGNRSLGEFKRCLASEGRYVLIGGGARQLFEALLLGRLRFLFSKKSVATLSVDASKRAADLATLADMQASGKLKPVIERTFGLDEIKEAMRFVEKGHVRGKVVLRIAEGAAAPTRETVEAQA